jgi:hypothetical protein
MISEKTFNIVVIVVVVLTGICFGVLTGFAYSESYWWAGMIAGAVTSFPLAKLYLMQLRKIYTKEYGRKSMWLLSTLIAVGCGVICTTVVHGVMTVIIYNPEEQSLMGQMDGFWSLFLLIGEAIGACAGLIVGGICSLVYVLSVKGKSNASS